MKMWLARAAALAVMLTGASHAQEAPPYFMHQLTDGASRTMVFLGEEYPRGPDYPPPKIFRTRLFASIDDTPPGGVAAYAVRMARDCVSGEEVTTYTEYDASGAETRRLNAVPAERLAMTTEQGTDRQRLLMGGNSSVEEIRKDSPLKYWRELCSNRFGTIRPAPASSYLEMVDRNFIVVVQNAKDAIEAAREHRKDVEAALALSDTGQFAILPRIGDPVIVDIAAKQQGNARVRLAWVTMRENWYKDFDRSSYLVDCAAETGARELVVSYYDGGKFYDVLGPTEMAPFAKLLRGDLLRSLCKYKPSISTQLYPGLTAAMAATRAPPPDESAPEAGGASTQPLVKRN